MNETEKFLEETGEEKPVDIMDQPLNPEATAGTQAEGTEGESTTGEAGEDGEVPDSVKNRRHRRLERELRAERESNIRLAERIKVVAEAGKTSAEEDWLKGVERIYGTDSPEAIAATELLKGTLRGLHESAKRSATEEIREERRKEVEAQQQSEAELESMIEEIEDEKGVNLTDGAGSERLRKGFFTMLQKMSPKDANGNIVQYADHHAVWDAFQAQVTSRKATTTDTRAKNLASRSSTHSGSSSGDSKAKEDANAKWLRENGII